MKLKRLQELIDSREKRLNILRQMEQKYETLIMCEEQHGDCKVDFVSFLTHKENICFSKAEIPDVPAAPIISSIGESIETLRRSIERIEDLLKGIVEFDEDEEDGKESPSVSPT